MTEQATIIPRYRVKFIVEGRPVPQGSVSSMPIKIKGGGYVMRTVERKVLDDDGRPVLDNKGKPIVREAREPVLRPVHSDEKRLKRWRARVAAACRAVHTLRPIAGPVYLTIVLYRPRPKNHYRSNGDLKPNARKYPTTMPDSLKVVRGIEDALKNVAWLDDAQVVDHVLSKRYSLGTEYRTVVEIAELE